MLLYCFIILFIVLVIAYSIYCIISSSQQDKRSSNSEEKTILQFYDDWDASYEQHPQNDPDKERFIAKKKNGCGIFTSTGLQKDEQKNHRSIL